MRGATISLTLGIFLCTHAQRGVTKFWVSEPVKLNDTLSVTCSHNNSKALQVDAKLYIGTEILCEKGLPHCKMAWNELTEVTYTVMGLDHNKRDQLFKCQFSQTKPLPVIPGEGGAKKLFEDDEKQLPPPQETSVATFPQPTDPLVWALTGACVLIGLYGLTVTILFLRLKARRKEVLYDTLLYQPVRQQQIQAHRQSKDGRSPRELSEEYMDMRAAQQKTWPTSDMNHNTQNQDPYHF